MQVLNLKLYIYTIIKNKTLKTMKNLNYSEFVNKAKTLGYNTLNTNKDEMQFAYLVCYNALNMTIQNSLLETKKMGA